MDTIKLKAYVTRSRQLTVELPPSFPTGEVKITVEAPLELYIAHSTQAWSEADLDALLDFTPTQARELSIGNWDKNAPTKAVRFVDPSQHKMNG